MYLLFSYGTISCMKHRKKLMAVGLLLFIVCALLYIYIYKVPEITGALTPTVIVEYGEMKISKKVSAVIVRDERVYPAEIAGSVSYYVDNNTKTRKGTKICDIYGAETKRVLCPETGVVSYYFDGYESVLTPDTLADIDTLVPVEGGIEVSYLYKDELSQSEALYKLIRGERWYAAIVVPNEELGLYQDGAPVRLEFESSSVDAFISKIIVKDSESIVVTATSKYFKDYDRLRCCELELVLRDDKGLIVPNSAISSIDGNTGVFVKKIDGKYKFERVKVINSDGENSVVYADSFSVLREDGLTDTVPSISIYDEILKDASESGKWQEASGGV